MTAKIENFQARGGTLTKVVINASEGEAWAGIHIGKMIYENRLDVEIPKFCFASCVSYIFPAGAEKRIHKYAIVAWNGNEHKVFDIAEQEHQTIREYLYMRYREADFKELSEEEYNDIFLDIYNEVKNRIYMERDFYRAIGVNINTSLLGFHFPKDSLGEGVRGYTYDIEEMEKLGIVNIIYQ